MAWAAGIGTCIAFFFIGGMLGIALEGSLPAGASDFIVLVVGIVGLYAGARIKALVESRKPG